MSYTDISSTSLTIYDKNENAIRNSIRNILYTPVGSFPGNPYFGSDLQDHVFGLNDEFTKILVKRSIERALKNWEPRVKIEKIEVETIPEYNRIDIYLYYSVINDVSQIVYSTTISL